MNIIKHQKLSMVEAAAGSAGTELISDAVDMLGFESCAFFLTIATANAGNYIKVTQCDTSGGNYADLEGTKKVATVNGNTVVAEVFRPRERYLKASVIRAGTNTATGDMYALQCGARTVPVTQPATVEAELNVSPAEGTA